jgi:hypothetical protein
MDRRRRVPSDMRPIARTAGSNALGDRERGCQAWSGHGDHDPAPARTDVRLVRPFLATGRISTATTVGSSGPSKPSGTRATPSEGVATRVGRAPRVGDLTPAWPPRTLGRTEG